jgi:hypothetical protein
MDNEDDIEEKVARDLLHYFTSEHPTGVKYEDQPQDVKNLWLGAARVAIKAVRVSVQLDYENRLLIASGRIDQCGEGVSWWPVGPAPTQGAGSRRNDNQNASESHVVELDDDSAWTIFPGDIAVTLNWEPDAELKLVRIIVDELSSHALVSEGDNSRVRVKPAGGSWPAGEVKAALKGG